MKHKEVGKTEKLDSKRKEINNIKYLIKQNNLKLALEKIDEYLEKYPGDPFAFLQYGTVLLYLRKTNKAKEVFSRLVEEKTKCQYSALYKLGKLSIIEGNLEEAEQYFKRNIEISPYNEIYSIIELVKIEKSRGNYKAAMNMLENCPYLKTEDSLKIECAKLKYYFQDLNGTKSIISTIKELNNNNLNNDLTILKSRIAKKELRYDDAEKKLKRLLKNNGNNIMYWKVQKELASLYEETNRLDESRKICNEIVEANENYKGKATVILGNIYLKENNYDEAINAYKKAYEYDKRCLHTCHCQLGEVYMRKREYDKAVLEYRKEEKTNIITDYHLMMALLKNKQYGEALDIYEEIKYFDYDPNIRVTLERAKLYLDIKLDNEINYNTSSAYSKRQMVNYSIDEAIKHIDRKHIKNNVSEFKKDVDIRKLILEAPKLLENKVLKSNDFFETYDIYYPTTVGMVNNCDTNKLRIVTFPDCGNVLTMYPCLENEDVKEEEITTKKSFVKRKSQVEKFNEKYGIN